MEDYAIRIHEVSKVYKLYNNPMDRLKESLKLTRKKNYSEYFALDKISFDVKKGETLGIIGTNGAGKSTILKIITGVLSPTSGSVEINGKIAALLELGAGFNMEYTGIQNIYLNGTMMGFTRAEMDEKVNDIVEFAGIGDFINQPVKTYSSGMFARLAFAVAINVEPDILIVDEALSVGDIYFQAKCFKKMDEIKRGGTTVLIVTHDLGNIIKYCDRAILLNKGEMIENGSPKKVVDIYKMILVNQFNVGDSNDDDNTDDINDLSAEQNIPEGSTWKEHLIVSGEETVYGNNKARIIDFGLFDEKGLITNVFMKNRMFTIKLKIRFNEHVDEPIFAYTFKNEKGVEITGTNTLFEKAEVESADQGDVYIVSFEQKMTLQGGEYLMSFGCTGYEGDEFVVYDRLYDITNVTVVSSQNTVGYYDMNSVVDVKKMGSN